MNDAVNIGKALKTIRNINDWTLEEMAAKLGTTKQALSRYERGERSPKIDVAVQFAKILDISLEELAGIEKIAPANVKTLQEYNKHTIPLIGSAAAGEPVYNEEVDVYVDGPIKADCAIRVQGNSMNPTYLDGDVLYIRSQPDIDFDGQVAVAVVGDEACVKHVYRQPEGLLLTSDNPSYAPMFKRYADYDDNIRIIGKIVGFTRMYKE